MDINTLITRLRDIAWDFPPEHSINRAADMLTVLQAENNKLQDELKWREAEIARLNEAREIANEKAREYEATGLELEEIITGKELAEIACGLELLKKYQELGNVDRLRELVEADKEGRCVVLPCKVGDIVFCLVPQWVIDSESNEKTVHKEHAIVRKKFNLGCMDYIEKSVFLTREAAEAALKEREQNE